MDLATVIGIISGLVLIGYAVVTGGDVSIFIHIPSAMIVFGGAIAATLVNFPLKEVIGVMGVVRKAFIGGEKFQDTEVIDMLVDMSQTARKEGILAIEKKIEEISDNFLRSGMEMAVDGTEPETIRSVMETELSYLIERHKKGQMIFISLGTYAPAFGMIGTLIGLISMLRNLEDPTKIGGGMAVALVTTFYGSILANLIFLPIAGKLKNRSDEEIILKEMIIEGVLAIQYGEHPRNINRKLLNFVPPKLRVEHSTNGQPVAEVAA